MTSMKLICIFVISMRLHCHYDSVTKIIKNTIDTCLMSSPTYDALSLIKNKFIAQNYVCLNILTIEIRHNGTMV